MQNVELVLEGTLTAIKPREIKNKEGVLVRTVMSLYINQPMAVAEVEADPVMVANEGLAVMQPVSLVVMVRGWQGRVFANLVRVDKAK